MFVLGKGYIVQFQCAPVRDSEPAPQNLARTNSGAFHDLAIHLSRTPTSGPSCVACALRPGSPWEGVDPGPAPDRPSDDVGLPFPVAQVLPVAPAPHIVTPARHSRRARFRKNPSYSSCPDPSLQGIESPRPRPDQAPARLAFILGAAHRNQLSLGTGSRVFDGERVSLDSLNGVELFRPLEARVGKHSSAAGRLGFIHFWE